MTYLIHTYLFLSSFISNCVSVSSFGCNASYSSPSYSSNSSSANVYCKDVIKLHDGSALHFECGGDYITEKCRPPSMEFIRYCGESNVAHEMYFFTECLNDSLLHDRFLMPYETINTVNLSSVNSSYSCSNDSFQPVSFWNNSAMIKSPNWPHSYGHIGEGHRCQWRVDIPVDKKLKVFYMYLNLNGKRNNSSCEDNIYHDSLVIQGRKNNETVQMEHFCGYNPSFAKYYDASFDSVFVELIVNNPGTRRHDDSTGFVIGIVVFGNKASKDIFYYWWIIPIVFLLFAVIINCLRKKINNRSARKKRERAFTNSLTTLPATISKRQTSVISQHRISAFENLGQVLEETIPCDTYMYYEGTPRQPGTSSNVQISFSTTVDVFG